jgi:BirA family biotin operon repressor/biotin-[acetyl-CoA-carboxylase] ligase
MAGLSLDGVPVGALAARWGVPRADVFATLPSTLAAVHALCARGAPAGSVVLALEQTAGRGRDGPTWRSPLGGVWLGVLLRPASADAQTVAIRAGLALADALDALLGGPLAQLKWPNDVVLDDRKVAGILCEGRWQGETLQGLALGIGVNVVNALPSDLTTRAIALRELVPEVRRLDVLDRAVPMLARLPAAGELTHAELAAFAARDWLRGRQLRRPAVGRAAGLAPDGALFVEAGSGTTPVRDGHVELA